MGGLISLPAGLASSCLFSSAASCCSTLLCSACGGLFNCTKSVSTRFAYLFFFILVTIFGWILQNYAHKILDFVPVLKEHCIENNCFAALSVDRLMFGYSAFHLLLALLMIGVSSSSDPRMSVQDGLWPFKLLLLAGFIVGSFFIPNSFFVVYDWISFSGAIIFIVIQLLLLLDFAHNWSENWTDKLKRKEMEVEEGQCNVWLYALLFGTFGMFGISIAMDIVLYVFFAHGSECKLNTFFVTFNLIFCIFFSLGSITPFVQSRNTKASLLPSAVITLYVTYLVWSAIMSEPADANCSGWKSPVASNFSIFMGAAITFIAVSYSTISAATSHETLLGGGGSKVTEALLAEDKEKAKGPEQKVKDEEEESFEDDEKEGPVYNYTYFHVVFMLGAMYMSELISNWSVIKVDDNNNSVAVDSGMVSVWIKIATSWVVILLYIWTLFAPIVFPDREF